MKKNNKVTILICLLFVVVAVTLLAFGISQFIEKYKAKDDYVQVTAVITRIDVSRTDDETHTVYVRYNYNDVVYNEILDGYTYKMYVGKTMKVTINSKNPREVTMHSSPLVTPIIMICAGLMVAGACIFLLIKALKNDEQEVPPAAVPNQPYNNKIEQENIEQNNDANYTYCDYCGSRIKKTETRCKNCGGRLKR